MKILALEFSSLQRSVAVLAHAGGGTAGEGALPAREDGRATGLPAMAGLFSAEQLVEAVETGPGAARAVEMIERVLGEAAIERERIERVVVGTGPGSYTGIRAAIAVAQGWQLADGVKLQGLSSAECIAWQALAQGMTGRINVVIDAQRGEFYFAGYELGAGVCREVEALRLVSAAEVRQRERGGLRLVGPEATRWFPSGRIVYPSAAVLARMAVGRDCFIAGEKLEPIYLRETAFVKAAPGRILL